MKGIVLTMEEDAAIEAIIDRAWSIRLITSSDLASVKDAIAGFHRNIRQLSLDVFLASGSHDFVRDFDGIRAAMMPTSKPGGAFLPACADTRASDQPD